MYHASDSFESLAFDSKAWNYRDIKIRIVLKINAFPKIYELVLAKLVELMLCISFNIDTYIMYVYQEFYTHKFQNHLYVKLYLSSMVTLIHTTVSYLFLYSNIKPPT